MASREQIARILGVAHALSQSKRGVVLRTLADSRGWRLRSLYRDIEALEAAGFPIEHPEGRYRLTEGWLPPGQAGITPDEVAALFVARQLASGWRGSQLGRSLDRLWTKLTTPVGRQGSLLPTSPLPVFTVRAPGAVDYRAHAKNIAVLERGIADRRVVSCRYRALSTRQITARAVEPGELHWDPALESLYLVAWCRLRAAVRVFAVHRFMATTLTDDPFAPRPETRSRAALRGAFRIWRSENVEIVRILFQPPAADEIREKHWHASQRLDDAPGGGVILTLEVAGLPEIERWVLGFGEHARVLAPAALAESVARRVRKAAGMTRPGETVSWNDKAAG